MSSLIFAKEVPNKPKINDTGSSHINNVTKPKSIEMMMAQVNQGFPQKHDDEEGPTTNRELVA